MGCWLTRYAKEQRKNNVTARDDDVRDEKAVLPQKALCRENYKRESTGQDNGRTVNNG